MSSRPVTYGRRAAKRQRRTLDSVHDSDDDGEQLKNGSGRAEEREREPDKAQSSRKKQRLQVEVILPASPRTQKGFITPSPEKKGKEVVTKVPAEKRKRERSPDREKLQSNGAVGRTDAKRLRTKPASVAASQVTTPLRVGHTADDDDTLPTAPTTSKRNKSTRPNRVEVVIESPVRKPLKTPSRTPAKPVADPSSSKPQRTHELQHAKPKAGPSTRNGPSMNGTHRNVTPSTERHKTPPVPPSRSSQTVPPTSSITPKKPPTTYLSRTPSKGSIFETPHRPLAIPQSSPLTPFDSSPGTPHRSPLVRTATLPAEPHRTVTPNTPPKDLSSLFNFASSSKTAVDDAGIPRTPSKNPKPRIPLAKRMLARSRTEASLDEFTDSQEPSAGAGKSFNSIISISSTRSLSHAHPITTAHSQDALDAVATQTQTFPDSPPQRPPPAGSNANIRTYAGRSRSFLVPLGAGLDGDAADSDDLGLEVRESYTDLRTRWGVDNSEDDPRPVSPVESSPEQAGKKSKGKGKLREEGTKSKVWLPPGMMNDLKSITELRSKGESRRFMDEVGYLFEGMDRDVGVGVRRGSALEIVSKLCDAEFARRAKTTDFLSRAWDVLRGAGAGDGDKVLDAILVLFVALAAQTPRDLLELAQKPDFTSVLCSVLSSVPRGKDPLEIVASGASDAELKKAGIGKPEKLTLNSLRTTILKKSGLAPPSTTCPPLRQLLSQTLSTLPPTHFHPEHFVFIHRTLLPELALLPSRLSAYTAGLSLLPDSSLALDDTPSFEHIENCLGLVDSFLLGRWAESEESSEVGDDLINGDKQEDMTEGLVTLCVVCNIVLKHEEYEELHAVANKCMESALRVLINLSHDNAVWCKLLLHHPLTMPFIISLLAGSQPPSPVKDEKKPLAEMDKDAEADTDERDAQAFDRLCLALGLLTNLVQADDEEARDLVRETEYDPTCPGKRACARACFCSGRIGALECLVRLYLFYRKSDADADDPGAQIVRGHLAVLFGLLMRRCPPNEARVLDALPGATRRAKLDGLVGNAREFVGLYREVMVRVAKGEGRVPGEEDAEDEWGERRSVERNVRDGASEGVAKDVIEFLEQLRDG
ncbi:hypothetical protein DENSPDRAFT_839449 [Dentipellis sp. KUC8613]|nr:hypothetical protein DENSPDRAFT_839449 [Dentipellis sp. KUC8613]